MDYFGGSKKACLLCESFLQALARPVTTRGRHGICYPAWGVPPSTSPGTAAALNKLDKMLVSRVKSHLADSARFGKHLVAPAVHQSTVASAYSDLDVVQGLHLHHQIEAAQSARKAEQKLRVMRNIQQGHKSQPLFLDPVLPESQQYASCVMCNHRPASLCNRCRSCYYCSKECQE
ncbi:hypothetical protein B0I37DRAFT_164088 [Chaetomium sp. MPI-CAGE-AT-0009]|nr:hypothetical protein B0I37DRAFT_164088 [Chaetomium sp. MPI-CAGE-AT-0009]